MRSNQWPFLAVGLLAVIGAPCVPASADTLVLRDGDRLDGELVRVEDGEVEFRSGWRTRHSDLEDVSRIDFDRGRSGGHADRRRSGLRERTVDVPANEAWTSTGISVRSGHEVYFEANGKITWGPGRRDDAGGEGGRHHNAGRPIPRKPGGALIGKIGSHGDPFFIGKEEDGIRMRATGTLYLGINDDYLLDNGGGFRVTVHY
jgi:hypothetical protein